MRTHVCNVSVSIRIEARVIANIRATHRHLLEGLHSEVLSARVDAKGGPHLLSVNYFGTCFCYRTCVWCFEFYVYASVCQC